MSLMGAGQQSRLNVEPVCHVYSLAESIHTNLKVFGGDLMLDQHKVVQFS